MRLRQNSDPGALRITGDADLVRSLLAWAPTD